MMALEEFLGLIPLKKDGCSMTISYVELCRQIARCSLDRDAYLIVDELEQNGYIETTLLGERRLTPKGVSKRIPIKFAAKENAQAVDPEVAWKKFRVLCDYYRDCVKFSEKSQEALFDNQFNVKFILPILPYDWLKATVPFEIKTTREQSPAVSFLHLVNDYEEIFIGYPLSTFKASNGSTAYAPIFLIPVSLSFGQHNRTQLTIHPDGITINQNWLSFNVGRENHKSFMMSMVEQHGENAGRINIDVALQALNNHFKNKRKDVVLDPNYLNFSLTESNTVLNTAALFMGSGLKYTKNLRRELAIISTKPASELDKTALAYVFRDPPLPNEYTQHTRRVPLRFIPANEEQNDALMEALNRPASKVTGPPGTGKSQVAVNLIANHVYDGESVLFTSKNHKAIHAISEKSEKVMPGLVRFCSVPGDSSVGEVWYKIKVENEKGRAISDLEKMRVEGEDGQQAKERVDAAREDWTDRLNEVQARRSALRRMQQFNSVLGTLQKALEPIDPRDFPENLKAELRKYSERLLVMPPRVTLLRRIVDFILWRKRKMENARGEILKMLPSIGDKLTSAETLKRRVETLLGKMCNFDNEAREMKALVEQVEQSIDYEELLQLMAASEKTLAKNLQTAIRHRRFSTLSQIPDETIDDLKGIARVLSTDDLPFVFTHKATDIQDKAVAAFGEFVKFFPAWACTLLSLTRASPCIPGLFDRVVIDEASQCEIPPIIPALYRSKGVTIVGDPAQFPPVITLRPMLHESLKRQYHVDSFEDARYDFMENTAYSVLPCQPVMLCEHFRCHSDITAFCNDAYYNGKLQTCTNFDRLNIPRHAGFRPGIDWHHISDSPEGELDEVERILKGLTENGYDGSVGVITPFRQVADELKVRCKKFEKELAFSVKDSVNTTNGFQGDERDLIIFVLAFTSHLPPRKKWYVEAEENAYIYNVAASRARACLIIVGDRERARTSSAKGLRCLAKEQKPHKSSFDSPAEKLLFDALVSKGLKPVSQYPLVGRYLDLALVEDKIDIEIDGLAYHLNKYGERKADDIFRDLSVESAGWKVIRFWAYEIDVSLDTCVCHVLDFLKKRNP